MLFLKDLVRLSLQHRTVYCYLMLWILLIIIGMYKYVSTDLGMTILSSKSFYSEKQQENENEMKKHHINQYHNKYCNDVEGLVPAEEGGLIEGWTLQGNKTSSILRLNNINLCCFFRNSDSDSTRRKSFAESCTR